MTIATSARDALELMAKAPFDVIVSDMRMPVMDGASFLTIAREKYPATMRVVLSGQTDAATTIRALPVAHQFLSKPADPILLLETLERVALMKREIADPSVRSAIGSIGALPCLPAVCHELTAMLARDDVSMQAIANVVEGDPGIVAKLLQVVNSSFFGVRRRIASVVDAVSYLGTEQLKNVVVSVAIASCLPPKAARFDAGAFHRHSLEVARLARAVAGHTEIQDTSVASALLHDVGKLAMASTMPLLFDAVTLRQEEAGASFEDVEAEMGSCGHARLGACLLDLWGIPFAVVEGVLHAAKAPSLESAGVHTWDAVHLAHRLLAQGAAAFDNDADRRYLARIGIADRMPALFATAAASMAPP